MEPRLLVFLQDSERLVTTLSTYFRTEARANSSARSEEALSYGALSLLHALPAPFLTPIEAPAPLLPPIACMFWI